MPYGTIKVDNIIFTNGGSDQTVTVSGIVASTSGNLTVTGTISGGTVKGTYGSFTSLTGVTTSGTNANFQTITGAVGVYTTSVSGLAVNALTANIVSGVFASGTAAVPSITFTGNTTAGIYSPGADQVAISTSGTGRLFVQADGDVSIGQSTGNSQLVVKGSTSLRTVSQFIAFDTGTTTMSVWERSDGAVSSRLIYDGTGLIKFGTSTAHALTLDTSDTERARIRSDGTFEIKGAGTAGTSPGFSVNPSTPANSFVIDSSGRLGLGTSSPNRKLEVSDASADNFIRVNTTGATKSGIEFASGSTVYSQLYFNNVAPYDLSLLQQYSTGSLILGTNNTERARIDSSGRLGIGTSSPITQLNNTGTTSLGTVNWPTTDAGNTAGRVLIGNEGILFMRNETVGAGSKASLYLGAKSGAGSATFGHARVDGGTENAINRASFFSVLTSNTLGDQSTALYIDSSQRVGIGTTGPTTKLHVQDSGVCYLNVNGQSTNFYISSSNSGGGFFTDTALPITFGINSLEKARIDSSGRLLVGTSSARSNFFNSSITSNIFQIERSGANESSGATITTYNSGAGIPFLAFARSNSNTTGTNTLVTSGQNCGLLSFQGNDGTEFVEAARIFSEVDGTPGADDMPGRLVFSTTADGAASPTERMRISSNGNILINSISLLSGAPFINVVFSAATNSAFCSNDTSGGSGSQHFRFFSNGVQVGNINTTTTATAYATSSDYRLKENVALLTGAIDRVNQLQVHRFNFIADPDTTVDGFLAHEAQEIVPECVTGTKDEVDEDGNPIYQGIDQSKLVPLLTAALQEAIAEIASLKDRVAALEAS